MRTKLSALTHGFGLTLVGALAFPGQALAGWGDDNWGTLVWGAAVSGPEVPGLGLLGGMILAMGLAAIAAWMLRKRRPAVGLTLMLVLVAIPLVVVAGEVMLPNSFTNGTVADADEVNANFNAVKTAVDDNDARVTNAQSAADAAESAAVAAQAMADAAQIRVTGTCPAGSSIQTIAANGTVSCEVDDNTDTTYSAGSGLTLTGTTFSTGPSIVSANVNSAGVLELTLSDGTVLNAGTVSAASDPAVAQGAWNSAIWGPFPNGGVWQ